MVVVEKKQLDDSCGYLMLVESWTHAAGQMLWVADAGQRQDWYVPNWQTDKGSNC